MKKEMYKASTVAGFKLRHRLSRNGSLVLGLERFRKGINLFKFHLGGGVQLFTSQMFRHYLLSLAFASAILSMLHLWPSFAPKRCRDSCSWGLKAPIRWSMLFQSTS